MRRLLFLTTLSALAFNGAFLFPVCGFLILAAPVLLITVYVRLRSLRVTALLSAWYGVLIFGVHFIWLIRVLCNHSQASLLGCTAIYGCVVGYFVCTYVVWMLATVVVVGFFKAHFHLLSKGCFIGTSFIGYHFFIERWILYYVGLGTGYPFINPLIPLARYRWFLAVVTWFAGGQRLDNANNNYRFVYVPPVVNRVKNVDAAWRLSPDGVGQKLFHQISRECSTMCDDARPCIVLSPESTFMFPLNEYQNLVRLWSLAMPHQSYYLLGGIYKHRKTRYQAVFLLQGDLIINVYVKKILTPFVEHIPPLWRNISALKCLFFRNKEAMLSPGKTNSAFAEYFDIGSMRIVPRICLEFFFTRRGDLASLYHTDKDTILVLFANDSWFCSFFKSILKRLVALHARKLGIPIINLGHKKMCFYS